MTAEAPVQTKTKVSVKLTVDHDEDTESPCDNDQWKLYSFCNRHINYKDPSEFFKASGQLKGKSASKVGSGTAFLLSYYEHGLGQWSLKGEGNQCQFDTVQVAGVLVWEGPAKDCGGAVDGKYVKTFQGRQNSARVFLNEYSDWANGQCFQYSITDMEGEEIDGCGGIIGWEYCEQAIKEALGTEHKVVSVEGDQAEAVRCYMSLS